MVYQVPPESKYSGAARNAKYAGADVPIIIDNGTSRCRAGYANAKDPHLVFENVFAKFRNRSTNRTLLLAGEDTMLDSNVRQAARSPYDATVVTNWDAMEGVLDYVFSKLGLEGKDAVNPIVMTETVCNMSASRKVMSELLFECYSAPSVLYGIDSLFSYHQNGGNSGIVIGSGNLTTHVIPVVNGKGQIANSKRLSLGGSSVPDYMLRLAQLKYPAFPTKVTTAQATALARQHCYVSPEYRAELKNLLGEDLVEKDRSIQFPFVDTTEPEKDATELAIIAQRKYESGKRLQEAAAAKRLEKLIAQEQDLDYYLEIKAFAKTETKKDFQHRLQREAIENEAVLDTRIKTLEALIKKARNKDLGIVEEEVKQIPDFSLVDVPDDQLDEAQIKQKRGQKLMKYGYDARIRAKAEKEAERVRVEAATKADEERRLREPQAWVLEKRLARQQILDRMKDRKKLKAELTDRKSLASQMRMKHIAGLAATNDGKRKRKNDDDTFGMDDSDWHVYRDIANESDNEEEEEDDAALRQLESTLLQYDSTFSINDTIDAKADPSKSLLYAFYHGPYDPDRKYHMSQDYQLHLNVERIRAPEIFFTPSLVGMDTCGLVEIVKDILTRVEPSARSQVVQDFYTTGGNSSLAGFNDRLRLELPSILPASQKVSLRTAKDPFLDAWRGAAKWSQSEKYKSSRVTKQQYQEYGSDYMIEHGLGNLNL